MRFAASITNRAAYRGAGRQSGGPGLPVGLPLAVLQPNLFSQHHAFISFSICRHLLAPLPYPLSPSATPQTPQLTFKLFAFGAADCLAVFAFCGYGYPANSQP